MTDNQETTSIEKTTPLVLSEVDLTVMKYMLEHNYISPRILVSIDTLKEKVDFDDGCGGLKKVTRTTICNSIKKLLTLGYVNRGAKLGRTNRYFISADGAVAYYQNNQLSDEEKKILVTAYGLTREKEDNCSDWKSLFNEVMN